MSGIVAEQGLDEPGAGEQSSIPSSSLEVKIRTLESDLKSMAESGGSWSQSRSVAAPIPSVSLDNNRDTATAKRPPVFLIIGFVLLLVVAGFVLYYFVYPLVVQEKKTSLQQIETNKSPQEGALASPGEISRQAELITPSFGHSSFFQNTSSEKLVLRLEGPAASASDLRTYTQKTTDLLAGARTTSTLIEVEVQNKDGSPAPFTGFLQAIDAGVLDPQFFATNFEPDFTYFIYKDKQGYWPGYVLALKPGQNWLFLKSDVMKLEESPKLENLFITAPGKKTGEAFQDGTIERQPVRALVFDGPGGVFIYGWFRGYFIMSTSNEGLKQALSRI